MALSKPSLPVLYPPGTFVHYEGCFREGGRSYQRLGEALVRTGSRLVHSKVVGGRVDVVVLVEIEKAGEFQTLLAPLRWNYRSPFTMDTEGRVAWAFSSPEEELEARAPEVSS